MNDDFICYDEEDRQALLRHYEQKVDRLFAAYEGARRLLTECWALFSAPFATRGSAHR